MDDILLLCVRALEDALRLTLRATSSCIIKDGSYAQGTFTGTYKMEFIFDPRSENWKKLVEASLPPHVVDVENCRLTLGVPSQLLQVVDDLPGTLVLTLPPDLEAVVTILQEK